MIPNLIPLLFGDDDGGFQQGPAPVARSWYPPSGTLERTAGSTLERYTGATLDRITGLYLERE